MCIRLKTEKNKNKTKPTKTLIIFIFRVLLRVSLYHPSSIHPIIINTHQQQQQQQYKQRAILQLYLVRYLKNKNK